MKEPRSLSSTESFPHIPHTDRWPRQAEGRSVQQTVFGASVQSFNYFFSSSLSFLLARNLLSLSTLCLRLGVTFRGLLFGDGIHSASVNFTDLIKSSKPKLPLTLEGTSAVGENWPESSLCGSWWRHHAGGCFNKHFRPNPSVEAAPKVLLAQITPHQGVLRCVGMKHTWDYV